MSKTTMPWQTRWLMLLTNQESPFKIESQMMSAMFLVDDNYIGYKSGYLDFISNLW